MEKSQAPAPALLAVGASQPIANRLAENDGPLLYQNPIKLGFDPPKKGPVHRRNRIWVLGALTSFATSICRNSLRFPSCVTGVRKLSPRWLEHTRK